MKVLITGANGFIAKNLAAHLGLRPDVEVLRYVHESTADDLKHLVAAADFICHLAGVNRPKEITDFARENTGFTETLCREVQNSGRKTPIIFSSSVHAERKPSGSNTLAAAYGASKLAAENVLLRHSEESSAPVYLFRLPHVMGKWCRPNYNSVVATFCHNIAHDRPIRIEDPSYPLTLIYVDDLITSFSRIMSGEDVSGPYCEAGPQYSISVGELASQIRAFHASRSSLVSERVGNGLTRALHATYLSYLPTDDFVYTVPKHADARGVFVEMLKTHDSGQISYFTAHPGVTRGGHYHHSKTEKFMVVKGRARFRFCHIVTNERHEILVSGDMPQIVEMVPGWAHDITNMGDDEMIVLLWANETFDHARPDTFPYHLSR